MAETDKAKGEKLLTAVERIIADDAALIATTEKHVRGTESKPGEPSEAWLKRVGEKIVSDFSTRSALSGGAAALPAIVPGFGTAVTLVGGVLADVALMLKWEVEMALCLSLLHGYDIRDKRERQLAFLLASVSTYDARSNENVLMDLARAEGTALWNYTPRQVSKALVSVMAKIVLMAVSKSFARLVPVVGVVVGASANKLLTKRVGERCMAELARRLEARTAQQARPKVKARIRKSQAREG